MMFRQLIHSLFRQSIPSRGSLKNVDFSAPPKWLKVRVFHIRITILSLYIEMMRNYVPT